ncbi:hypothetical protein EVAR_37148_1 [Eumeta japonica]|uniref:Uncharacterized protein n=1 Tax=Eumeta variegata TaxID=151549 RepID=A0A4C1WIG0_EUMVA|nr:hypothetical protein EVAR_37148_1 [Eumeta japonica]
MRLLRSMCGVSRKDRCRNSDVRERCGLKGDVVTKVERGVTLYFSDSTRINRGSHMSELDRPQRPSGEVEPGRRSWGT